MKLIFAWSQMLVTDELKRRKRAVGLMFFDFIEALARLADFISLPSMEQLIAPAGSGSTSGSDRGAAASSSSQGGWAPDGGKGSSSSGVIKASSNIVDRAGSTVIVKDGAEHPLVDYLRLKGWLEVVGWRWLSLAWALLDWLHRVDKCQDLPRLACC